MNNEQAGTSTPGSSPLRSLAGRYRRQALPLERRWRLQRQLGHRPLEYRPLGHRPLGHRGLGGRPLGVLLALLLALTAGGAVAQDLSAQEVLDNLEREVEATEDATFLVTGRLVDADGTSINLEVDVEVIPSAQVARANFYQPDALADNVIVLDGDAVYNYIFLTNQVTVFDANDPDALGGLLGSGEDGEGVPLTLDLNQLFRGWEPSVEGYEDGRYRMRLDNLEEGAALGHVLGTIDDTTWQPTELRLFDSDGNIVAELFIEDFESDVGLSPEDVAWIPEDAEVIDERD